jgi:hypothetical protein
MAYENRLTCFIDILGFKNAITKSKSDQDFFNKLFAILNELNPDVVLESQQTLAVSKFGYPSSRIDDPPFMERQLSDSYPLKITQFSDSFVLSCSTENLQSGFVLLSIVSKIVSDFFWKLGLLVRGGIVIGELAHDGQRIVFGPAMNEAYELESKQAIYPRILISNEAYEFFRISFGGREEFSIIDQSFDGYRIIDLISILMNPYASWCEAEILQQLERIESEIAASSRQAHPKIAYLKTRFNQHKVQV